MNEIPESIQLAPGPALVIRDQVPLADLTEFFSSAYGELGALGKDKIAGPPFAIYHSIAAEKVDVSAGFPLLEPVAGQGRAIAIQLDGGPAVQVKHVGAYEDLGTTYVALENWLASQHRVRRGPVREVYLTEPTNPPSDQVTMVVQPILE